MLSCTNKHLRTFPIFSQKKKKRYRRCRKGEEAVREGGKEVSYPAENVIQKKGVTDKIKLGK